MQKIFKIESIINIDFANEQDYYNEIENNFETIKKDFLSGSRNFLYTISINKDLTNIKEENVPTSI